MDFEADSLTSGSREGRGVAIPPIATALCFKQIATSRLKMFARKLVSGTATPKRSGQTEFGSAIINSNILAFKSHLAAFKPAAKGPSS